MADIPPDVPIYVYIKRELKNRIENGDLAEGDRVPSELDLAREYGVSRNPTRQAMRDLEQEGYIVRSPGRGSFVAPKAQRQRLLRVSAWRTVAFACPELECRYTRSVVRGFIECAAEKGFHTMVYFQRFSNEAEIDFLADIRNSGIEGVAFWLQHASQQVRGLLDKFQGTSFPFVLVDRYVRSLDSDYVVTDNEDAGYRLTKALIDRGHTDIGFLTPPLDNTAAEDRLAGYERAVGEARVTNFGGLVGVLEDEKESAGAVVHNIMALRTRPTAFCCSNDGVTAKLLDELDKLGYATPRDVEVATVDDNEFVEVLDVPVITASQVGCKMGRASAEILIARIEEPARPIQQRLLKAILHNAGETATKLEGGG